MTYLFGSFQLRGIRAGLPKNQVEIIQQEGSYLHPLPDAPPQPVPSVLSPATEPIIWGSSCRRFHRCAFSTLTRHQKVQVGCHYNGCYLLSLPGVPNQQPPCWQKGVVLGILGHVVGWPFPCGGSQKIADALAAYFSSLGGELVTGLQVESLDELPSAHLYLCDLTPRDTN